MTSQAEAIQTVRDRLLGLMHADGYWEGRLSSSALSTATAVSALSLAGEPTDVAGIDSGLRWLAEHQNADGGWGDTIDSPSNLATTLLAIAAVKLAGSRATACPGVSAALEKAEAQASSRTGATPRGVVQALRAEYGEDRTFAVPILMNCGLAGLVDWDAIPGLPFEMAVVPPRWYRVLRLHVVSYALPALIAIGLLLDDRHPSRNFLRQRLRRAMTPRVVEILQQIQPEHGGFLEATPLTSFVAMGLIPRFGRDHPITARCLGFLRRSQRADGSWPIDTNLSVWLTTAAVASLASAGALSRIDRERTALWIAARQQTAPHPYTHAAPGGWSWTHLPGGVPDVDDTAGAILALTELDHRDGLIPGVRWLLDLQNRDGGWPTFCRGWGKLPFDKSAPDLTAHALRAIHVAGVAANASAQERAIRGGLQYLRATQRSDGSWLPLWFGNQAAFGLTNPVLGTSRVLRALELLDPGGPASVGGVGYLLQSQNADGGWGGDCHVASTPEETALAVAALTPWATTSTCQSAIARGVDHLIRDVAYALDRPSPIGLYFAHLWYSERLYPVLWMLDALGRVAGSYRRT